MPLSLTDDELRIVMRPRSRSSRTSARILRDVAAELEGFPSDISPGFVSRVSAEVQRRHFAPPQPPHLQARATKKAQKVYRLPRVPFVLSAKRNASHKTN